jgi:hypothetical protein
MNVIAPKADYIREVEVVGYTADKRWWEVILEIQTLSTLGVMGVGEII